MRVTSPDSINGLGDLLAFVDEKADAGWERRVTAVLRLDVNRRLDLYGAFNRTLSGLDLPISIVEIPLPRRGRGGRSQRGPDRALAPGLPGGPRVPSGSRPSSTPRRSSLPAEGRRNVAKVDVKLNDSLLRRQAGTGDGGKITDQDRESAKTRRRSAAPQPRATSAEIDRAPQAAAGASRPPDKPGRSLQTSLLLPELLWERLATLASEAGGLATYSRLLIDVLESAAARSAREAAEDAYAFLSLPDDQTALVSAGRSATSACQLVCASCWTLDTRSRPPGCETRPVPTSARPRSC